MKKTLFTCLVILIQTYVFAQVTPLWINSTAGTGDNSDRYNAVTKDAAGNLYMAGYEFQTNQDKDFLVVKMSPSGVISWSKTFNGADNGSDKAFYIGLDAAGNIYVSGVTDGGGVNQNDILLLKYNTSGTLLWSAVYNNATYNQDENPLGMAVDSSGNVYITGSTDRNTTIGVNDDILTLKYNSSGTLLWAAQINGLGNGTDRGASVTCNNSGNCYITGRTDNGSDDDIITIKYNSAGTEAWRTIYSRTFGNDRGESIKIDALGNAFIAGRSTGANDYDLVAIKYNSLGIQQFASIYNNAGNDYGTLLQIDPSGNIIVGGQTDADPSGGTTNYDFLIVKFNASGVQQWAMHTGNLALNDEDPSSLQIDATGNIYMTGKSDIDPLAANTFNNYFTVKYSAAGVLLWSVYLNGTATNSDDIAEDMVLDAAGFVYVCGGSQNLITQKDATIIKYNASSSATVWTQSFNGTGDFTDKVQAMVSDTVNNIYVTGYVMEPEQRRNLFVKKINSTGTTLWYKTYDNSSSDDEGKSIAVDDSGNVYVTGNSIGSGTSDDYVTLKYNSSGTLMWASRYDFTGEADVPVSIALGANGTVYVTGYSDSDISSTITNYDIVTIAYSVNGVQTGLVRFNGVGNGIDKPVKAIWDGTGLNVAGTSNKAVNNDDVVLIRYNSSLVQQWLKYYSGAANGLDEATDMATEAGYIYVVGHTYSATTKDDYLTFKYNTAGTLQWAKTYNNSPVNGTDRGYGIVLNSTGVWVTGRSAANSAGVDTADVLTIKYSKTGGFLWASRYNGTGSALDRGNDIAIDKFGNPYATGESVGTSSGSDIATLIYDANGIAKWVSRYTEPGISEDVARLVITDKLGYMYVAGYSSPSIATGKNGIVIKYCPPPPANAGPDLFICNGATIKLAGSGGTSYNWTPSAGLSNATIAAPVCNPAATTTYILTVSNGLSCSAKDTVIANRFNVQAPTTSVTPVGPLSFCNGSSLLLTATTIPATGLSYSWKKSTANAPGTNTATTYSATSGGTYSVVVANPQGCSATSNKVVLAMVPTASFTASGALTFCNGDSVVFTANSGTGYTYQWYKNSAVIPGATLISYSAKTTGAYKVVVTEPSGCSATSSSKSVNVNCRLSGNSIFVNLNTPTIFPNPFSDFINIHFENDNSNIMQVAVDVFDLSGRMIRHDLVQLTNGDVQTGSDLPSGTYIIKVTNESGIYNFLVVKSR